MALSQYRYRARMDLRDPSHLHWYVVTFLGIVMYVYANEVERRRWDIVAAGLAFFLMDVFNELVNSAWWQLGGHPLWGISGDTAYKILVGWTIEIAFLFAISGIEFVKFLPPKGTRILGVPNRVVFVTFWSCFATFVEELLHAAGILTWHWTWWNAWFPLPIVVFGYGTFFAAAAWVFDQPTHRRRVVIVGSIACVDLVLGVVFGMLGWL